MSAYPMTYTIFDERGRPSIKTDNHILVEQMLRQGWTAVRHWAGDLTSPVTL